jgi:hypothetical protein
MESNYAVGAYRNNSSGLSVPVFQFLGSAPICLAGHLNINKIIFIDTVFASNDRLFVVNLLISVYANNLPVLFINYLIRRIGYKRYVSVVACIIHPNQIIIAAAECYNVFFEDTHAIPPSVQLYLTPLKLSRYAAMPFYSLYENGN